MSESANNDDLIALFEQRWWSNPPPDIGEFLNPTKTLSRASVRALLVELISVDLEYRWSPRLYLEGTLRERWKLEDYICQFPDLLSLHELPLELIGEEYRVRRRWGDRPTHDDYFRRFVARRNELAALLKRIDLEMRIETDHGPIRLRTRVEPSATTPVDPRAPPNYSAFVLKELIGAGRTGKVYRALQRSTNRHVAIKYLRKEFMQQPAVIERFVAEAKTISLFQHPNVVSLIGLGQTPASYFMAMDLIEGPDLERVVRTQSINIDDAIRWIAEAAEAIEHAHQHGVVHCDLKPGNLLLDLSGKLYVTDFGFAQTFPVTESPIERLEGTAPFMAPEQVSSYWGTISPRTDVYGLGAVLFTLLAGFPPFRGDRGHSSIPDILAEVVSARPSLSINRFRRDLPPALVKICDTCLAKQPADRYQTAGELRQALLNL